MSDAPKFRTFADKPKSGTFRDLRSLSIVPVSDGTSASIPSLSSIASAASSTSKPKMSGRNIERINMPISPEKDFQKVPNSISRSLDLFRGKSKQVWDYLWSVSRGAVKPARIIRKSRKEIKDGSAIGSFVTLDAAIRHLEQVGLIKKVSRSGSLVGNEYEIFTPEEAVSSPTSLSSIASRGELTQKVAMLGEPESSYASIAQTADNKDVVDPLRLSLKTSTRNDDEPFGAMIDVLAKTCEKVSGKVPQKGDRAKWRELAELLAMELEIAAARTGSISSVPAFLTEHLRRRLIQKLNAPKPEANKTLSRASIESELTAYEAEPLTQQGREVVLKTFKEYVEKGQHDFVMSFEKTYTKEDWMFLMGNLK